MVKAFIDELYSKMQADGIVQRGTYDTENKAVLTGVTLDLFALRKAHPRMYVGYFRGQREFLNQRQYLPSYMESKDRFIRVIGWLEKQKYITNELDGKIEWRGGASIARDCRASVWVPSRDRKYSSEYPRVPRN